MDEEAELQMEKRGEIHEVFLLSSTFIYDISLRYNGIVGKFTSPCSLLGALRGQSGSEGSRHGLFM